jgi:hypothetical protein
LKDAKERIELCEPEGATMLSRKSVLADFFGIADF